MEQSLLGELDSLIQQKLDGDTEFQESLEELDEEARKKAIDTRHGELLENELARLKNSDELAENYKVRAEKAERALKANKPQGDPQTPIKEPETGLSVKDSYAMQAAGVPFEDVDEVVRMAKVLGKSITDALSDNIVTARLQELKSFRESERAANSGGAKGGARDISDDKLLKNLSEGEVPKAGSKEAERLFMLRRKQK